MSPVPDPLAWAVNALCLIWEDLDTYAFPSSSHPGKSGGEAAGLPMQENHSDCSRVTQHALVWGFSGHIKPDPLVPAQPAQLAHTTIQSDSSQESVKPKSTCLDPGSSAIKEQGFSEAVAA